MPIKKILLTIPALIIILLSVLFLGPKPSSRNPASLALHDHKHFDTNKEVWSKPRAAVRIVSDSIVKTENETFVLKATVKASQSREYIKYNWHLPDSALILRGDLSGTITGQNDNSLEIEISIKNPDEMADVYLEASYEENGFKMGGTKNFSLNDNSKKSEKFIRTKAAFQETLHQKIFQ